MKFTLLNLLIVNAFVAVGMGLVLSDETRIKQHAEQRQCDMNFIAASKASQRLPIDIYRPAKRIRAMASQN